MGDSSTTKPNAIAAYTVAVLHHANKYLLYCAEQKLSGLHQDYGLALEG